MKVDERIKAFSALGTFFHQLPDEQFQTIAEGARMENPWFTKDNVRMAIRGLSGFLSTTSLSDWIRPYELSVVQPRTVAVVMAGNIPLVGFHDLLSVLISGHSLQVKLSSKDNFLTKFIIGKLIEIEPRFKDHIYIVERLRDFDAVIATGSDNSSRYFDYYFSKYPNVIRKNRTSVAILDGSENEDNLQDLGTDIFSYFGLGCRNVSKLFIPEGYDFDKFYKNQNVYQDIIHHHKYCNNYDYQKSILLVNGVKFLDNGFLLLQENQKLVSPISVIFHESYKNNSDLKEKIKRDTGKIQCIVGKGGHASVDFGQAQYPSLSDYADEVDTLRFLSELS